MTAEWQPGHLYAPGDIVTPISTDPVTQDTITNADFESGDTAWATVGNWAITTGNAFAGTWKAEFATGLLLVAASGDDDDNIAHSIDGVTWTPESIDPLVFFSGSGVQIQAAPALGKWMVGHLIIGFGHESSDGGQNWSVITPTGAPAGGCTTLRWIPELNRMFYGQTSSPIYRSANLTDWTASTTSITGRHNGLAYSPTLGMLVLGVGSGTSIYTSTDGGDTWTARTIDIFVADVMWHQALGIFIAVQSGNRNVSTSSDGITWSTTTAALPAGMAFQLDGTAINASTGRIAAITTAGARAAYSDDGTTWIAATTIDLRNWFALTYDAKNKQFVGCESAGGSSDAVTSPDGITWTTRPIVTAGVGGWNDIAFGTEKITGINQMENTARLAVTPGQLIAAGAMSAMPGGTSGRIGITWHGVADALISTTYDDQILVPGNAGYRQISVSGVAPLGALTCSVVLRAVGDGSICYFDNVTISHATPVTISPFLFVAVQALPGYSDSFEPAWPTVVSTTVVDNEVTWNSINVNRVVWSVNPILVSGSSEPTFPALVDANVADNTISWEAQTRRIDDTRCPNTKQVAIVASKIFAADKDIIAFSATVNPLDWSTPNDAGFIPFGLNTYGSQDVSALALYRSNLVAFNALGFQMWQVDADPANFAILDAVPVGSTYHLSGQPVSNDLVFLTEAGIRSMGIAGASTNLQAGHFGKQIDELVLAAVAGNPADNDPLGLIYPGAGQYWLIFETEAFVLTMNGGKEDMSWSRYTFPTAIDNWTIQGNDLYLRSGDEVWRLSPDAALDRQTAPNVGTAFVGEVWWPYLDFGGLGDQKMMHGFDLVGKGACTITFGYDQSNAALVTANWTVADIDTLPGTMIPMPISGPSFQMRLTFSADQAWEWQAAAIYLDNQRTTS